jgi:hypothetical protein
MRIAGAWSGPKIPTEAEIRAGVKAATRTAALFAQALWRQRAQDLGVRRTGAYLAGIQNAAIDTTHEHDSATATSIGFEIVNLAPHAGIIENGHPAFSLAQAIHWDGPKVKRGKKGPYLMIAFRHNAYQAPEQLDRSGATYGTRRAMLPSDIYDRAKALGPKQRLHHEMAGPAVLGGPEAIDAWRGARAVQGRTKQGNKLSNPAWKGSKYHGLMRKCAKGHSQYLTIRVITPQSAGWNIPARMGLHIARQVAGALNGGIGHDRFRSLLVGEIRKALGWPK